MSPNGRQRHDACLAKNFTFPRDGDLQDPNKGLKCDVKTSNEEVIFGRNMSVVQPKPAMSLSPNPVAIHDHAKGGTSFRRPDSCACAAFLVVLWVFLSLRRGRHHARSSGSPRSMWTVTRLHQPLSDTQKASALLSQADTLGIAEDTIQSIWKTSGSDFEFQTAWYGSKNLSRRDDGERLHDAIEVLLAVPPPREWHNGATWKQSQPSVSPLRSKRIRRAEHPRCSGPQAHCSRPVRTEHPLRHADAFPLGVPSHRGTCRTNAMLAVAPQAHDSSADSRVKQDTSVRSWCRNICLDGPARALPIVPGPRKRFTVCMCACSL